MENTEEALLLGGDASVPVAALPDQTIQLSYPSDWRRKRSDYQHSLQRPFSKDH
jgi:hypothetical protein